MMDLMEIDGLRAVITYDPEIEMFRGEFVNLNGSADFYAKDIENLKKEGAISLKIFLEACKKRDIEPIKVTTRLSVISGQQANSVMVGIS